MAISKFKATCLAVLEPVRRTRKPIAHDAARQLPHRDPADRFLVATARVLELTLVTADERLIDAGAVRVLANR